jgi:hypothetical protein
MLRFSVTDAKRGREAQLTDWDPYGDPDSALAMTNRVLLDTAASEDYLEGMALLHEYLADQASGRTVVLDCESTETMRRDLSPSDLGPLQVNRSNHTRLKPLWYNSCTNLNSC